MHAALFLVAAALVAVNCQPAPEELKKMEAQFAKVFCDCLAPAVKAIGADLEAKVQTCMGDDMPEELKGACQGGARRRRAAVRSLHKRSDSGDSDEAEFFACLKDQGVSEPDQAKIKAEGEKLEKCMHDNLPDMPEFN